MYIIDGYGCRICDASHLVVDDAETIIKCGPGLRDIKCNVDQLYFWIATDKRVRRGREYYEYIRIFDPTWRERQQLPTEVIVVVPDTWTQMTDDEIYAYCAERSVRRAEMRRQLEDWRELIFRYSCEAKIKRRMRFKNPIKAIERLDARINNLVRYWNMRGCDRYLGNLITHFDGLRESLTKYRIDQEELAREAFKPSRVEYSLSCS